MNRYRPSRGAASATPVVYNIYVYARIRTSFYLRSIFRLHFYFFGFTHTEMKTLCITSKKKKKGREAVRLAEEAWRTYGRVEFTSKPIEKYFLPWNQRRLRGRPKFKIRKLTNCEYNKRNKKKNSRERNRRAKVGERLERISAEFRVNFLECFV